MSALAVGVAVTVSLLLHAEKISHLHTLEQVLSNTSGHVTIRGAQYRIVRGQVSSISALPIDEKIAALSLLYEKTAAIMHPTASIAGSDNTNLRAATALLEEIQNELTTVPENKNQKKLFSALFPIQYLQTVATIEEARQRFITSGDYSDFAYYREQQRRLAHEAIQYLTSFKVTLAGATNGSEKKYAAGNTLVSPALAATASEHLSERFRAMLSTISAVDHCARYPVRECTAYITIPHVSSTSIILPLPSTATIATMRALFEAGHPNSFSLAPQMYATATSSCLVRTNQFPLFGTFDTKIEHATPYTAFYPVILSDMRFVDMTTAAEVSHFHYYLEHQVRYAPVSELNVYECTTLDKDIAAVTGMHHAATVARELYDVGDAEMRSHAIRLLGRIVREDDAVALLNYALGRLDDFPERLQLSILDTAVSIRDHSSGFDIVVTGVAFALQAQINRRDNGVPINLSAGNILLLRSGFNELLNSGNDSFGPPVPLFEPLDSTVRQPFVYASDLFHQGVSPETLTRSISAYYKDNLK